jgi:hypothetical protein
MQVMGTAAKIFCLFFSEHFYMSSSHHYNWLCHWLYTPREDGKAKCLLLLGKYIDSYDLPRFFERLKQVWFVFVLIGKMMQENK